MDVLKSIVPQLILIGILTSINGFLAATEMALVSLDKNRIIALARKGEKKAKRLEKLVANPSNFLSTIQVGITFAGFFSSAYAATGISDELSVFLNELNIPNSKQYAVIIITLILSYLTLVFGELVPKRIALKSPRTVAMIAVIPMVLLSKITYPFVKLLSFSTNTVVRLIGFKPKDTDEKISEEEIRVLVDIGYKHGAVNTTEKELIEGVFEFNDKVAKEIMTDRKDVFEIEEKADLNELMNQMTLVKFSRIPVYRNHKRNIVGVLYVKDLLRVAHDVGFINIDISKIMREPYVVQENERIDLLFKKIVKSKKHMAILKNNKGDYTGIVTLEDVLEELVGEIYDEHDDTERDLL
ncbi:hemolysin family protein [Haloplasma contractile]|uniref:ATP-dependent Clp protease protease subunit protein n=1 Tax=Haloplasma contractile SSD-17B TaxID=1033810 RepID=F7PWB8_9MOLU|nr:hemolysin family protein [Haloplasma contractile]ERJ10897.1 ATP-dependent Clp protease protease subunit protein [Haloplasma contractile SSD-17B]